MAEFLNIYDMNRRKTAVLQNAFSIAETQELNKIYTLDFQIPAADEKVKYILPFHFVRYGDKGELYRIIKVSYADSDTSILSVSCEHVIAVLCDELMFGAIQYGGGTIKTSNVIAFLLSKQKTQNWVLAECDFDRRFEYLWEQENILNALYGIPKEFSKAYKWTFDTTVYPWRLSLKAIDAAIHPEYYIRAKRNLLSSGTAQDYTGVCTRIYALGYGEGVNQLSIKDATVTNIQKSGNTPINATVSPTSTTKYGNTYIQSPAAIVAQYGIKEKILVDRRFEDANSLMSYAQTMLEGLQTPSMTRSFDVIDLYPLTSQAIDRAEVGKICKMTGDDTIAYITKTKRVLDEPGNLEIDLSTKVTDVASSIADLTERVRIETVYAQGATQLYQHSKDANATPTKGMVMSLYFPAEMRQINKVLLRLKLGKFRSYSQATSTEDVTVKSCENKEVTVKTVENKEVTVKTNPTALDNLMTTQDGGGTTSSSGGTSVTVSGGDVSNQRTVSKSVSLSVEAEAVSSAPQEAITSAPSTEVTSDTAWNNDSRSAQTEFTGNGAVSINLGNQDGKLIGNTYALYDAYDGYHQHDYWGTTGEKAIDGGYHHHNVMVDIPSDTVEVINNDPYLSYYGGKMHRHNITLNGLAHSHNINHYHTVKVSGTATGGSHTHSFSIPAHTHTITAHSHNLPSLSHSHDIKLNSHTHTVKLNPHTHDIKLEGHSHTITAGIFESGNPTKFDIYVGGELRTSVNATSYDGDIATWLLTADKQIPRGQWIDIEIRPNDLAYVQSSVFVQGFVQSRGGGNY